MRRTRMHGVFVSAALMLIALLFGASAAQASPEDNAPDTSDGETYIIGTDTTFAPFEFRDDSGELVGIDIDIVKAIAEDQGFNVEFQSLGFDAALQALRSNQVDGVIAGMGITPEREEIYDFSDTYFTGELTLARTENNDEINGWDDLEGKTVAVKRGSLSEEWAQEMQEEVDFEITSLDQTTTMVQTVKAGNADALADDLPIIAYGIQQGSGLEMISEPESTGDYGFAVNKGDNEELMQMFNDGLKNLKESGEYDQIVDSYIGNEEDSGEQSFWELTVDIFPTLMKGLGNTLAVTGMSFLFAMVLGLGFGFLKISRNIVLRAIATTYIAIFRGTPILVWAFFFYLGLPQLIDRPVSIWVAGVLTLTLNGSSYIAEIVRGGIQSVDQGQMEASRSLALTYGQSMQKVILPQAFKMMTPSLINQLVIMIKDSSLLLAIGFGELMYEAQQIYAVNYKVTEVLFIVAVIYLVAIFILTQLANYIDRKVNK